MAKRKRKATVDTREDVTPERGARNTFQSAGMARKLVPVIDTLRNQGWLTDKEWEALSYYRDQASLADRSPLKSCIDFTIKGGGHGPGVAIMSAEIETGRLEREMGALWAIARAVAVDDWSLTQWAIHHHGGRERIENGKVVAIVPRWAKAVDAARVDLKSAARRVMGID